MSASLFDLGLFAFHNARALAATNRGPYVYLPKLQCMARRCRRAPACTSARC